MILCHFQRKGKLLQLFYLETSKKITCDKKINALFPCTAVLTLRCDKLETIQNF